MLHSFKECSSSNQYGNNSTTNAIQTHKGSYYNNNNNNNSTNNIIDKKNCQTIDIRTLESDGSVVHYGTKQNSKDLNSEALGGVAPTLLSKTHENRERITNMHSSGVTADSTAVIVNIGSSDSGYAENHISYKKSQPHSTSNENQNPNGKVRRTGSTAAYNEVVYHAGRRERKISSTSSLTNQQQQQQQIAKNSPHGGRQVGSRAQCARQGREQSPKFSESHSRTSRKRHQLDGSVEPDGHSRTSKEQHSRQHHRHEQQQQQQQQQQHQQHQQQQQQQRQHRSNSRNRHHSHERESTGSSSTASSCNGSCSSDDGDSNTTSTTSGEPNLPYPGFPEVALKYLTQDTRPRSWCLKMITNPYPFLYTN